MREWVWLMTIVVCVCRLGEEYVWGVCLLVSGGGGQEGYAFCCDN